MKNPIVTNPREIITIKHPIWNKLFLPNLANKQLLKIWHINLDENKNIGKIFFNYGKTKEVIYDPYGTNVDAPQNCLNRHMSIAINLLKATLCLGLIYYNDYYFFYYY